MNDKTKKYGMKVIVSDKTFGGENCLGFAGEVCEHMNYLRQNGAKSIRTFVPVIDKEGRIYHICYIESEEEV